MANTEIFFNISGIPATEATFPPTVAIGSNNKQLAVAYNDTTQEYRNGILKVPANIDTGGTVTLRVTGRAATGASSKTVEFDFDHYARADGEASDETTPYTTEASGAKAIDDTTTDLTIITWTETVSNLGWVAGDEVFFRISRDPGSNDILVGDFYGMTFTVLVPLT